jgi:outer membrane protein TolC
MQVLDFQKSLLEIAQQFRQLEKELSAAKYTLAKLINANPLKELHLVEPDNTHVFDKLTFLRTEDLVDYALQNRTELLESDYQRRIRSDETQKAFLRMLPGIELNASTNYDGNVTFANNRWAETGINVTWNLLNLLTMPQRMQIAEYEEQRKQLENLALNISILTQVNISHRRLLDSLAGYDSAEDLSDVGDRLFKHARATAQAANLSELELIRREADSALFEVRRYLAYADLQDAAGDFYHTLGAKFLPDDVDNYDMAGLEVFLRNRYWDENKLALHKALDFDIETVKTKWIIQTTK